MPSPTHSRCGQSNTHTALLIPTHWIACIPSWEPQEANYSAFNLILVLYNYHFGADSSFLCTVGCHQDYGQTSVRGEDNSLWCYTLIVQSPFFPGWFTSCVSRDPCPKKASPSACLSNVSNCGDWKNDPSRPGGKLLQWLSCDCCSEGVWTTQFCPGGELFDYIVAKERLKVWWFRHPSLHCVV